MFKSSLPCGSGNSVAPESASGSGSGLLMPGSQEIKGGRV